MYTSLKIATWEKLPIDTILNLCKTDREMIKICNDNLTWTILLKRDYNVDYRENKPLKEYINYISNEIIMLLQEINRLQDIKYKLQYPVLNTNNLPALVEYRDFLQKKIDRYYEKIRIKKDKKREKEERRQLKEDIRYLEWQNARIFDDYYM